MLKNYTSTVPVDRTISNIQKILLKHQANKIMFDYSKNGRLSGLAFIIQTEKGMLPIKMPARVDRVELVFLKMKKPKYSWEKPTLSEKDKEQAYRTAWKNIHDWLDAQMALLETEMVKMEEIFLPYIMQKGGQTTFEVMENKGFLLPDGNIAG